jgi:ABC-2 type transport system permease protein
MIGSLAQPLLFLFALGYGLGPVFEKAGQGNYIDFLAPGIIGMGIIFTAVFSGVEIIWDRQFGFLKETLVAPVSRFSIMLGRTLGGATIATIQGIVVFLISLFGGFHPVNWSLVPVAFLVMFLVAFLFTALGTMIGSKLQDMQGFQLVMNFLVMPIFFLSGSLFPLQGLSGVLLFIAKCNPLAYGIDAFRALFLNMAHFGLPTDLGVLSIVSLVFLVLGSYFFSKIEI